MRCSPRIFPSFPRSSRSYFSTTSASQCSKSPEDKNIREARGDVKDPRLGRLITDDFASLGESYGTPKYPVVLAHGLLGFDELRLGGSHFPGIQYWRGIREAMITAGVPVIIATVAASASIEERAEDLEQAIRAKAAGEKVNIIAHSMGALTRDTCPHHGSSFADYVFNGIGEQRLPKIYRTAKKLGIETGAFSQLTREYARLNFNPSTPDIGSIRYFSYGAQFDPGLFSVFRFSHGHILEEEGPNDGLVSVKSSRWGEYKGTLDGVSHLELINWTNRFKWLAAEVVGQKIRFNAIAFYLGIVDMLAREGL